MREISNSESRLVSGGDVSQGLVQWLNAKQWATYVKNIGQDNEKMSNGNGFSIEWTGQGQFMMYVDAVGWFDADNDGIVDPSELFDTEGELFHPGEYVIKLDEKVGQQNVGFDPLDFEFTWSTAISNLLATWKPMNP